MAIAVALGRKGTKQTKRTNINDKFHFMILHPYNYGSCFLLYSSCLHIVCYLVKEGPNENGTANWVTLVIGKEL